MKTCKRCKQEKPPDKFESKLKTVCISCNEAKNILGVRRNNSINNPQPKKDLRKLKHHKARAKKYKNYANIR